MDKNLIDNIDLSNIPTHIAIIMDGNGRWAKERLLPRTLGHKAGVEAIRSVIKEGSNLGVKHITLYAFSTENWKRPKEEIDGIMNLMRGYLKSMKKAANEHIAVRFIGDREPFDDDIKELISEAENADVGEVITTVQIALNYGGRDEIVNSVRKIAEKIANGELSPKDINEETISENLYSGTPECDLIIRPSGEERLSNFLLWESAYSEFVFMDVLWPDFKREDFDKALLEYSKRNRRFGGV